MKPSSQPQASRLHLDRLLIRRPVTILALAAALLLFAVCPAFAADETMPTADVRPGMVGYAKTVTTGTVVTTFTVEVISVLAGENGPGGDLILLRASGPVIDNTGGIVAGMSGSPVYLTDPSDGHDKVVGAISYGADGADARIGLATPINEMLGLLALPGMNPALRAPMRYVALDGRPVNLGGARILKAATIGDPAIQPADGTVRFRPCGPLVSVSGIGSGTRIYGRLREALSRRGFITAAAPGMRGVPAGIESATIEPGASLGAGIMSGDATIAGIGTVTYVVGGRVLGFGHPMLWQGQTGLTLMTGYVHTVWPSVIGGWGFKLASAGETTGTILEDRAKGLAGRLGMAPAETTMTVFAENLDTGAATTKTYRMPKVIAADPSWSWLLTTVGTVDANDAVVDAMRAGTADTTFTVRASAPDGDSFTFAYNNKTFSSYDISAYANDDLIWGLEWLVDNEFEPIAIDSIECSTSITTQRKTARVVDVSILGRRIVPGRALTVRTLVVPYGSHIQEAIETTLAVPSRFYTPYAEVSVSSGEYAYYDMWDYWGDYDLPDSPYEDDYDGVQDIIDDFESQTRQNEIVVTLNDWWGHRVSKTLATEWVQSGHVSKSPSSTRMYRTPLVLTYGSAARFSGSVSPGARSPRIELWMKSVESTETTRVAQITGTTRSTFARSYAPTTTASFYARFCGNAYLMDSYSSRYTVYVRGRLGLSSARLTSRRGQVNRLSGYLRPVHAGSVTVQRYYGGRWRTFKTVALDANGNWSWDWRPLRAGTYRLRTYWRGDAGHKAATSGIRTIRVL